HHLLQTCRQVGTSLSVTVDPEYARACGDGVRQNRARSVVATGELVAAVAAAVVVWSVDAGLCWVVEVVVADAVNEVSLVEGGDADIPFAERRPESAVDVVTADVGHRNRLGCAAQSPSAVRTRRWDHCCARLSV